MGGRWRRVCVRCGLDLTAECTCAEGDRTRHAARRAARARAERREPLAPAGGVVGPVILDDVRAQTDACRRDLLTTWGHIQAARRLLWHSRQRLDRSRALLDGRVPAGR